ncbi:MAG: hypothetical protein A3J38_03065 [Gammaproteobacteria bacterium RIFCSPHIGHO2_12_FULL_45_9]|nr:MAG: hypothetical protein A3J38_03065 [Gammaproteobacteria bacterium RIFCSPHIGHO2_12_FULL_45_9]
MAQFHQTFFQTPANSYDRLVVLNVGLGVEAAHTAREPKNYDFCTSPLHAEPTPNYFERTLSTTTEMTQAQYGLPELTGLTPASKLLIITESEETPNSMTMETIAHIIATSLGKRSMRFSESEPLTISLFHCVKEASNEPWTINDLAQRLVHSLAERHITAKIAAQVPMSISKTPAAAIPAGVLA